MDEFNFYNSENDGYRGSLGGYTDRAAASQTEKGGRGQGACSGAGLRHRRRGRGSGRSLSLYPHHGPPALHLYL